MLILDYNVVTPKVSFKYCWKTLITKASYQQFLYSFVTLFKSMP